MRQRWRAWAAAGIAVVVVGAVPLVSDRDSFPLSTFPMFSADIDATQSIATAVGVRADGSMALLTPAQIGATTVVNQAVSVVTSAIADGRAGSLCADIAGRVGAGVEVVEVVTEQYDVIRWFDGDRTPIDRVVHARCPVVP